MPRATIWKVATAVTAALAAFFWFFFSIGDHWWGNLVLALIFTALAALLWWRFARQSARPSL